MLLYCYSYRTGQGDAMISEHISGASDLVNFNASKIVLVIMVHVTSRMYPISVFQRYFESNECLSTLFSKQLHCTKYIRTDI